MRFWASSFTADSGRGKVRASPLPAEPPRGLLAWQCWHLQLLPGQGLCVKECDRWRAKALNNSWGQRVKWSREHGPLPCPRPQQPIAAAQGQSTPREGAAGLSTGLRPLWLTLPAPPLHPSVPGPGTPALPWMQTCPPCRKGLGTGPRRAQPPSGRRQEVGAGGRLGPWHSRRPDHWPRYCAGPQLRRRHWPRGEASSEPGSLGSPGQGHSGGSLLGSLSLALPRLPEE